MMRDTQPEINTRALLMHVLVDALTHPRSMQQHRYSSEQNARIARYSKTCYLFMGVSLCVTIAHSCIMLRCAFLAYAQSKATLWIFLLIAILGQTAIACCMKWSSARVTHVMCRAAAVLSWSESMMFWFQNSMKDIMAMCMSCASIEAYLAALSWMAHHRANSGPFRPGPIALIILVTAGLSQFLQSVFLSKCKMYYRQSMVVILTVRQIQDAQLTASE